MASRPATSGSKYAVASLRNWLWALVVGPLGALEYRAEADGRARARVWRPRGLETDSSPHDSQGRRRG